jgi:hypothetical protein
MSKYSHGFPHSLQANARIILQIRPPPLPSTPFTSKFSFIILSFDAMGIIAVVHDRLLN